MSNGVLEDRRTYTEERLATLRAHVSAIDELASLPDLSIYVTGSYGRREASPRSDLDLFFVMAGEAEVPRIAKILIDGQLIRIARELAFPEFSGDARYLEIHSLHDMRTYLGTPRDDYDNLFTARILLLLESVPLCNTETYENALREIIATYYRDFPTHEADFKPIFLLNDIVRFWRTVCLNYESGRSVPRDDAARAKLRIKNLKLKFSRPFTCFSTAMLLVSAGIENTPESTFEATRLAPAERVARAASALTDGAALAERVFAEYAWFLEVTARPDHELGAWIGDDDNHSEALQRAAQFGEALYQLLLALANTNGVGRYLVI